MNRRIIAGIAVAVALVGIVFWTMRSGSDATETTAEGSRVAHDSNFGANYKFDVRAADPGAAVLAFELDWTETQSQALQGGGRAIVHYDVQRLGKCSGSTHGNAAWAVTGYFQIDGGAVQSFQASRADGPQVVPSDPEITVGEGSDLALWFEATSIWGCREWDSNFGANYHFAID